MKHIQPSRRIILKTLFLTSLLLTCFRISTVVVYAAPETVVQVEPLTVSADANEQIVVNATIADVQNLYGFEIILHWNSSVLQALHVDVRLGELDGVLHAPFFIVADNLTQDEYLLSATSTNPAPSFYGNGTFFKIAFNATNSGQSTLDLETQLYDYPPPDRYPPISMPIDHITIDGIVNVIPEFSGTAIFLTLTAMTILIILFCKKSKKQTSSDSQITFINK